MCDLVERHIWALGKGLDQWQGPPDDDEEEQQKEEGEEEEKEEEEEGKEEKMRNQNLPNATTYFL